MKKITKSNYLVDREVWSGDPAQARSVPPAAAGLKKKEITNLKKITKSNYLVDREVWSGDPAQARSAACLKKLPAKRARGLGGGYLLNFCDFSPVFALALRENRAR